MKVIRRCASFQTEKPDKGRALDGHGFQFANSKGHGHIA